MKSHIFIVSLLLWIGIATNLNAQNARGWWQKGNEKYEYQNYSSAIGFYTKSIELQATGACYLDRSMAYIALKEFQKAIDDATSAMTFFQNNSEMLGVAFLTRAEAKSASLIDIKGAKEDYKVAIVTFDESTDILNPLLYANKGRAYLGLREYQKAIDNYTKAMSYCPTDDKRFSFFLSFRAESKFHLKDYQGVVQDCSAAITKNSENRRAYYLRGRVLYVFFKDTLNAKMDFKKILKLDKKRTSLSAFAMCFIGEKESGYALMNKFIQQSKDKRSEYYNMSCIRSLMGEEEEAIKYLDLALKNGWTDFEWLLSDEDFTNIRDKSSFKNLLSKYKN